MLRILSNNSAHVDPVEEEKKVRSKYPELLHKDETIIMAFKSIGEMGRDKQYLTNRRMLIKDGKGIGHKRRNYLSVPYDKIQAFSVQSAGSFIDTDVELNIKARGGFDMTFDFVKDNVGTFGLQQFFNEKVVSLLSTGKKFQDKPAASLALVGSNSSMERMMNWIGDNAVQLDSSTVEQMFTKEYPVLMQDGSEHVQIAFKVGRDTTIITNQRFLIVDVKGWTGKRIKFQTFLWSSISAYAVETAGVWDRDVEIKLYTNIATERRIDQDLRNGKADLFAVHRAFSDMILGEDDTLMPNVDRKEGQVAESNVGILSWDNNRPLDAVEMNKIFHLEPNILQPSEVVEMAFKGRRDVLLFTTRRLISCDKKGLTGRSIEYTSFPWSSILAFAVRTAGQMLDNDTELIIYTDIMHDPKPNENDPPEPGMAQVSFDFHKGAINILDVQVYVSNRILGVAPGVSIPANMVWAARPESGLENLISRIFGDMKAIDSQELNRELHTTSPLLLDGEDVVMAFKAGRDLTVFTNKRIISMDTVGLTGKKKFYLSIPFKAIRGFAAESAGDWDRDSELKIFTRNYCDIAEVNIDFRKGKADIIAIQKYVAAMVMENFDDAKKFTENTTSPIEHTGSNLFGPVLDFLNDDTVPEDAAVYEQKLRNEPPILLSDEHIIRVFRGRRDKFIYTSKRLLLVDVHGFSGKCIQYLSIPNKWISTFSVETAGHLDNEAEVFIHTDCSKGVLTQDVATKKFDIMQLHEYFTKLFFYDGLTKD